MNATENELIVATRDEWRAWLAAKGETEKDVWLVIAKASSIQPGVKYIDAVEEALCFGWIDSQTRRRDTESTYQRFSPRRSKSPWSRPNRERAERLIAAGLMAGPGQGAIDQAKRDGRWPE